MSDDTSSHVRVSHLYDELLLGPGCDTGPIATHVVAMSLVGRSRGWFVAKRREIRCLTQQMSYRKVSMGFRLAPSDLTLDDLDGS